MRRIMRLLLALALLSACAAPVEEPTQTPEPPSQEAEAPAGTDETGDRVLLTLTAPLADGRTLTLEAVGKVEDEHTCGVREVRVYDGDELLQTVSVREAKNMVWDSGGGVLADSFYDYTECWKPEDCMAALDLNFDGNTDFGLFGWPANNTIPYYYWTWDKDAGQYRYAFTLQGVETHPEEREISAGYKSGSAGSQWIVEYYRPDESGELYLHRVERDTCDFEPEKGGLDVQRGWTHETWVPPEGSEIIRPGDPSLSIEDNLVLVYRKVPVFEVNPDDTVSHFTEVWELKDGKFQMTGREEYVYDNQQP